MIHLRKIFFLIVICSSPILGRLGGAYAQNKKIDSLKKALNSCGTDTCKILTLKDLAWEMRMRNPDTSILLANTGISLIKKVSANSGTNKDEFIKRNFALCFDHIGVFQTIKGNFDSAEISFTNAFIYWDELILLEKKSGKLSGKYGKAKTAGNKGVLYYYQDDYSNALKNWLEALRFNEELNDKKEIALYLGNLGNVFFSLEQYDKSIDYCMRSFKMAEEQNDKAAMARVLATMGNAYATKAEEGNFVFEEKNKMFDKAIEFHSKALKYVQEMGNKRAMAGYLSNIGGVYQRKADEPEISSSEKNKLLESGLQYHMNALQMNEQLGDLNGMSRDHNNIGMIYTEIKKYVLAEQNLKEAIDLSNQMEAIGNLQENEHAISRLYSAMGKPKLALEHYKKYIEARDSIFSNENKKKQMRSEMNYEYDKKKAVADAEYKSEMEKQKAVADERNRRQNIVVMAVVGCLLLVTAFLIFVFRSLRVTKRQKLLIDKKNAETERQKHMIEEKQKEIIDSIKYASRIQRALITSEKYIEKNLNVRSLKK